MIFDVELHPGSSDGPPIDRAELSRLRRESGPRFRAFLAVHSIAWRPGLTRVPHPRNRRVRLWTGDPRKYPILTAGDRDRLAFGDVDRGRKEGRRKADAHWEALPGTTIACPPRGPWTAEAGEAVRELGLGLCPVTIGARVGHVRAFTRGRSVQETEPRSIAAAEIAALYSWMMEVMK